MEQNATLRQELQRQVQYQDRFLAFALNMVRPRHSKKLGRLLQEDIKNFEWQIPNFYSLSRYNCHRGDSVLFGGVLWHFEVSLECIRPNFISVLLKTGALDLDSHVEVTLGFRKKNGQVQNLTCNGFEEQNCYRADFHLDDFVQNLSELLPSGTLTIVCMLKRGNLMPELRKTPCLDIIPKSGIEKLSDDLWELMKSGGESDITIKVGGEEFHLHRNILGARVPFFKSMFNSDMKENSTGIVSIDDCEVEAFHEFVHFVYCGRVSELSADSVFGLFVLADKYHIDELKSECLNYIGKNLSVEAFCDAVNLAMLYDLPDLLQRATQFFSCRMTDIMKTAKWVDFMQENHIQANELMLKAVRMKDEELFERGSATLRKRLGVCQGTDVKKRSQNRAVGLWDSVIHHVGSFSLLGKLHIFMIVIAFFSVFIHGIL